MKNSTIGMGILIVGILGAGYLSYSYFGAGHRSPGVQPNTGAAPISNNGSTAGLAQSSDKVSFSLTESAADTEKGSLSLAVQLQIDKGWHVNAHPASVDGLVATSVSGTANGQALDLNPVYPPGVDSGIRLSGTVIEVYDSGAVIKLKPSQASVDTIRQAGGLDVQLRVQSCSDDGICLAPSTLNKHLNVSG